MLKPKLFLKNFYVKLKNFYVTVQESDLPTPAVILTGVWISLGSCYFLWHISGLLGKPNELGDFLAGFFSPLAFLWLVLGYYQQQKEIKLLQKEITATNLHMEMQNQMLKAERDLKISESMPLILFGSKLEISSDLMRFESTLINHGAPITSISVTYAAAGALNSVQCRLHDEKHDSYDITSLDKNQACSLVIESGDRQEVSIARLYFRYRANTGIHYEQIFQAHGNMLLSVMGPRVLNN